MKILYLGAFLHAFGQFNNYAAITPNPAIHCCNLIYCQIQTEHDSMGSASEKPVNSQQV